MARVKKHGNDENSPRCQAHHKTSNKFVMRGERCRSEAAMSVTLEMVKNPVLLCARHYNQWCNEPLSKSVEWSARDVVAPYPLEGNRHEV